jgi:hypothetical protein
MAFYFALPKLLLSKIEKYQTKVALGWNQSFFHTFRMGLRFSCCLICPPKVDGSRSWAWAGQVLQMLMSVAYRVGKGEVTSRGRSSRGFVSQA